MLYIELYNWQSGIFLFGKEMGITNDVVLKKYQPIAKH